MMRFATRAVHAGTERETPHYPLVNPIYQSATFTWEDFDTEADPMYTRYGNPSRTVTESALASIENASDALHLSSGMAAVAAVCSLLRPGDHILCIRDVYGGTYKLLTKYLTAQGVEVSFVDACNLDEFASGIRPNTKIVWLESPTNPVLRVVNLQACTKIAHDAGAIVVVDNTFATPVLQNPLDLGCDVVMHSATKYLNGHSDVVGGALMWRDDRYIAFREYLMAAGSNPSPFDSWLLRRGLKTLELRVRRQSLNAQRVAEFLADHPKIEAVNYPGLPSDAGHHLAKGQMSGFGGMLAFVVKGGAESARALSNKLEVFTIAASLGGVESLVGYPPLTSHAMLTESQRIERGILPGLLRLSIGIEDADDLIEDLDQALS